MHRHKSSSFISSIQENEAVVIRLRGRRRALMPSVAVIAGFAAAVAIGLHLSASEDDGLAMGDYGPAKQLNWSEQLVAGLNTHDVKKVPVLRVSGRLPIAQRRTVEAAMPASGCHYQLLSVDDRGTQGRSTIPGLRNENSTYRFDMTVSEQCPGETRTRVLGVMAIAEMGYWEPFYFVV
ncbi:hypothetical protein [Mycolicibacter minnesotensis]